MTAVHNGIAYGTELQEGATIAAGVDRAESGIERLSETLFPTLPIFELPEYSALRRELLFGAQFTQGAIAGQNGFVSLVNLAGSEKIVVIEKCRIRSPGGAADFSASMILDSAITGTTTTAQLMVRDRRIRNVLASQTVSRRGSNAGVLGGGSILETIRPTSADVFQPMEHLPVILAPGEALIIEHNTVNLAFTVQWAARERRALPGELVIL